MTYRGSECPGLESNQHVLSDTAPSRRRVYQFRHLGLGVTRRIVLLVSKSADIPDTYACDPARTRT